MAVGTLNLSLVPQGLFLSFPFPFLTFYEGFDPCCWFALAILRYAHVTHDFCQNPTVTLRTYPKEKTWNTGNICTFKEQDTNPDAYKKSCYDLRRAIKQAKCQYRTKIKSYKAGSAARRRWQGLHTIMDYKGKPIHELSSDADIPDELNAFYIML